MIVFLYRKLNEIIEIDGVSLLFVDSRHARVNWTPNIHAFAIKDAAKDVFPEKLFVQSPYLRFLPRITQRILRYYLGPSAIAPYGLFTGSIAYFYHCGHRYKSSPFQRVDVERFEIPDQDIDTQLTNIQVDMNSLQSEFFHDLVMTRMKFSDAFLFECEFFSGLARLASPAKMVAIRSSKLADLTKDVFQCRDIGMLDPKEWSDSDSIGTVRDVVIVQALNGCKYAFELSDTKLSDLKLKSHVHMNGADFLLRYNSDDQHALSIKANRQVETLDEILKRCKELQADLALS